MPTRLAVIDDHALFREGLKEFFSQHQGFEIAEFACLNETVLSLLERAADVVLLDLVPGWRAAMIRLKKQAPQARIIVVTASDCVGSLVAALAAGADGYVLKDIDGQALLSIVMSVRDGKGYVPPNLAADALRMDSVRLHCPAPDRDTMN